MKDDDIHIEYTELIRFRGDDEEGRRRNWANRVARPCESIQLYIPDPENRDNPTVIARRGGSREVVGELPSDAAISVLEMLDRNRQVGAYYLDRFEKQDVAMPPRVCVIDYPSGMTKEQISKWVYENREQVFEGMYFADLNIVHGLTAEERETQENEDAVRFPTARDAGVEALFKYFPYPTEDRTRRGWVDDLISQQNLYLSDQNQFDDPWELRPAYRVEEPSEEVERKLLRSFVEGYRGANPYHSLERAEKEVAAMLGNMEDTYAQATSARESFMRNFRIFCLATRHDDLRMWSQYADSHKGLCIEFDASIAPMDEARRVAYEDDYPTISIVINPSDVRRAILTKSPAWKDQAEYRFVIHREVLDQQPSDYDGDRSVRLPENAIRAIYMGSAMPEIHKNHLWALVHRLATPPSLYEAVRSQNRYELIFQEVPTIGFGGSGPTA